MKHFAKVIGIKYTLRGGEHLSKDETCVIVANHQSSMDILGNLTGLNFFSVETNRFFCYQL